MLTCLITYYVYNQTRWTMVILSSVKASGPLLNNRTLKMHSYNIKVVFKVFLEAK